MAKFMKPKIIKLLIISLVLTLPDLVQAQFGYTTNNNEATITGYTGSSGSVSIPSTILVDGVFLPVTSIGDRAFEMNTQ